MASNKAHECWVASGISFGISIIGWAVFTMVKSPVDDIIVVTLFVLLPAEVSWGLFGFFYKLRASQSRIVRFIGTLIGASGLVLTGFLLPVYILYRREYLKQFNLHVSSGNSLLFFVLLLEGLGFGFLFAKNLLPEHIYQILIGNNQVKPDRKN
jgi:hypothetical protein